MVFGSKRIFLKGTALAAIAAVSACAPTPAPAPPPPPVVVVIPPQPMPPVGAQGNLAVPPRDQFGVRRTINVGISSAQTVWNLRSAYNVAALNCMKPEHAQIVVNYRAFLKAHAKGLAAANRTVDSEFKARHGARFIPPREAYMTQVYNYFALPPTQPAFCDAALAMSVEGATVAARDLDAFAARSLPVIERVFLDSYNSYDQYRSDLAAWQARYAPHQLQPVVVPVAAPGAVSGSAPAPAVLSPTGPAAVVQPVPAAAPPAQVTLPSR